MIEKLGDKCHKPRAITYFKEIKNKVKSRSFEKVHMILFKSKTYTCNCLQNNTV